MTFDSLVLPGMLSHPGSSAASWDACKLAQFSQAFPAAATQGMQYDCYNIGGALSAPSLSQGYAPVMQPAEFQQPDIPYALEGLHEPSFPVYNHQPQLLQGHDAALLQVLQSQMAAASLLAAQSQPADMGMGSVNPMALDLLAQGQYLELLNQASLQAVQSVLQQRLMTKQQLGILQQLLKQESQAAKPAKRTNSRNSCNKQRNQARSNSKRGGVAQQAPSWADGNWNPMTNVQAKNKEKHGTGVFLPQGFSLCANEVASDQLSEASSDQSSGSSFDMLVHQEC